MKNRIPFVPSRLVASSLLAIGTFASIPTKTLAAAPPVDSAHAAHVASGAMPPDPVTGDPTLSQQVAQLQAKVAQFEANLATGVQPMAGTSANAPMPGMAGAAMPATPAKSMGMDKMKPGAPMPGMSPGVPPAPPMASTSAAAPAAGMMAMMSQMMGMMDKMISMNGGSAPMPSGGMAMDKMKMAGGSMPPPLPAGMSGGGGTGMDKMEMAAMMGMGAMSIGPADATPRSALPGFPGASHLYHIGATGFFLDQPQHISLTTEQQAGLNKAKEKALLAKSTADRAIQQAEQELWILTAADQPDAVAVQAKIAAIEKMTGDTRFSFIRAVGEASKLLTDEQRKSLTGFAPPTPAAAMPAGGMKDM